MQTPKLELEFLGFEGCPNTPVLRDRLTSALANIAPAWGFTDVDQVPLPPDDIRRGYPAPTILIAGKDLFGLPVPVQLTMSCRLYAGGLPSVEEIAMRLRTAMKAKHSQLSLD